jgi:hypothetical protein
MKKNKVKYRLVVDGKVKLLCAKALYKEHIKGCWQTLNYLPYQSKSIVVELNLASSDKEPVQWVKVKLLFVRSVNEEKQQASKHDWALFLTTDSQLDDEKILEVYALRWGIEVYFKEAKQKLGFLKEQSRHYSAYIASIHLTGLRFCLLLFPGRFTKDSPATIELHVTMDLLTCSIDYFALTADTLSKRLHAPAPEKLNNTLTLEDAGYFDRARMMNIEKNGGFVIGQAACSINPVIKSAYGY